MSWGCPYILKNRSGMHVYPTDENLSYLGLGAAYHLITETFKFKNFKMRFPATYNNGDVVKY